MFSQKSIPLCRSVICLVLSAVVFTWGIVPPATQHTHVGGSDSTHRHDDCYEVAQHDCHDHESHEGHHECATVPQVSLPADYALHLHWRLLGIEFSIPMPHSPLPGEPADDTDDAGAAAVPVIVRVMNEIVPATQAGPSFARVLLAAVRAPSVGVVWSAAPIARSPDIVTTIPLCESARLERSGVLLV